MQLIIKQIKMDELVKKLRFVFSIFKSKQKL